MTEEDFEPLYSAGSDPKIWEQHPEHDRYQRQKFARYFQSGIESKGALVVLDRSTDRIIGSSRFTGHDVTNSIIEIGYTFLARDCWGKGYNSELKKLMLDYAFKFVGKVQFYIGETNYRSRRAVEKLGAMWVRSETRMPLQGSSYTSVVYEMTKQQWQSKRV